MPRVIAYMTCVDFSNKYGINTKDEKGVNIPQKKLMDKIYNYELKNKIRNGLYFY